MTIVWGILCLGFIIFIHELGHFIVARLCGVAVESFSLGMGPVLLHKTIRGTDYRLSLLPFGGYCGMKGEQAFRQALEQNLPAIPKEQDSFYGVHPLKRVCIAFAGPAMNLLFTIFAFSIIAGIGYTYYSADNRVIMADEIYADTASSAHAAGLETGDYITSINGKPVTTFADISEAAGTSPGETLSVTVQRDNRQMEFSVPVAMDTATGIGKIGVMNWIEPVVTVVEPDSPAASAGFEPEDRITAIDGYSVQNTADIQKLLTGKSSVAVTVERSPAADGVPATFDLNLDLPPDTPVGFQFSVPERHSPRYSIPGAILQGFKETGNLIVLTLKSIVLLFKGIDLTHALSGPVRITVMLGDTVKTGFSAGIQTGIISTLQFLALISISLFIMNLLPVPVLDGGLILFGLIEAASAKPIHPKIIYYGQFAGVALIFILFGIALFSDARYIFTGLLRR